MNPSVNFFFQEREIRRHRERSFFFSLLFCFGSGYFNFGSGQIFNLGGKIKDDMDGDVAWQHGFFYLRGMLGEILLGKGIFEPTI